VIHPIHLFRVFFTKTGLICAPGLGKRGGDADGSRHMLMSRSREISSALGKKLGAGGSAAGIIPPMPGAVALKDHEPRLTEREKSEIKNFRSVLLIKLSCEPLAAYYYFNLCMHVSHGVCVCLCATLLCMIT
jgi:hypothetical protein